MILQLWYQEVVAAEYIATLLGRIPLQEKRTVTCETKLNWQKRKKTATGRKIQKCRNWPRPVKVNRFDGSKEFRKKTFRVFKSFSSVGGKIQIFVTSMSNRTSNVCSINRENRKIRKIITSHFFPDSIFLSFWKKKRFDFFRDFSGFRISRSEENEIGIGIAFGGKER